MWLKGCTDRHPTEPALQIQVPRMGYLPILAEQALIYFRVSPVLLRLLVSDNAESWKEGRHCDLQHVLPPGEETPWFEVNSLPLRWHVPLGVLYDLLTDGTEKPWHLVVSLSRKGAEETEALQALETVVSTSFDGCSDGRGSRIRYVPYNLKRSEGRQCFAGSLPRLPCQRFASL